ncbi:MFS transporter [Thiosocius teredinicola]|uniref:MFS transporter n=1 Tax=Thiosocius teredinicola TaxID=1973002 RepID=UPI0009911183
MTQTTDSAAQMRISYILLASTLTVMAGATMAPALPEMHKAFADVPHAELLVKSVVGLPGLVVAVTAPLIGYLFKRVRKATVLLGATLLYGLCGGSGYFLEDSLGAILIGRIGLGIAVAGIAVASMTLIADHYAPEQRARYLGLKAAFTGFGGVLFMFLGGVLADIEWTFAFLLYFAAILLVPGLWRYVDEPHGQSPGNLPQRDNPPTTNRRWFYAVYLMAIVEIVALYMVPLHLPFYLQGQSVGQIGGGASEVGSYIAIMLLAMALVASVYARLRRLADPFALQAAGLLLLAVGIGSAVTTQTTATLVIALAVVGSGLGIMRPNLANFIIGITPPAERGRVMGKVTTSYFLGQFIAPLATQPLVSNLGYPPAFVIASTVLVVVALSCLLLRLRYPATALAFSAAGKR